MNETNLKEILNQQISAQVMLESSKLGKGEMPYNFIFVRHGESEANVAQQAERIGAEAANHQEISLRPDWQQRLTARGREQAKIAGEWLRKEFGSIDKFDGCFVSPFLRTRETASYLGGQSWIIDDRLVERFRGIYGVISHRDDPAYAKRVKDLLTLSPWYARIDWAESLQDVLDRYRAFQTSIKKHFTNKNVLVVTHGDFIKVAQYSIEWMLPEIWEELNRDLALSMPNCGLVHYTRINPENPLDIRETISWKRIVFTSNEHKLKVPNNGDWNELATRRSYSADDLREMVDIIKPLLDDDNWPNLLA